MPSFPRVCGIYCIRNKVTGDCYVGQSVNIYQRWEQHKEALNEGSAKNLLLLNAWMEYGAENFEFEILQEFEEGYDHLQYWENAWILRTGGALNVTKPTVKAIERRGDFLFKGQPNEVHEEILKLAIAQTLQNQQIYIDRNRKRRAIAMLNHVDQTGFAPSRAQMKTDLLRMMGKIGVIGVLELISEVAEDNAESMMMPSVSSFADSSDISFWQMTAAHTKELSERLWREHEATGKGGDRNDNR